MILTSRNHPKLHGRQAGFTIVELMIATLVFSTVLLVITFGIIQFSRSYYRGTTTTTLQNTTRSVIDSVSQAIQFSGTDMTSWVSGNSGTYCIGGTQFDYVLHSQRAGDSLKAGQSWHVLYSSPAAAGNCSQKGFNTSNGVFADSNSRDIVDPNIRIVKFSVAALNGNPNVYTVDVRLAYGDDDLLCSPSANDCSSKATSTHLNNTDLVCKIANGSQFCAVSELSTIVQKRVQ